MEKPIRLLHLEDKEDDRFIFSYAFRKYTGRNKVHLEQAGTYEEFQSKFVSGEYDGCLIDIQGYWDEGKEISGIDVLERTIKAINKGTLLAKFLLTGRERDDPLIRDDERIGSFDNFFVKPQGLENCAALIEAVVNHIRHKKTSLSASA